MHLVDEQQPGDKIADTDPFADLSRLRAPAGSETVGLKKVWKEILVRKPKSQEWIRIHPDEAFRGAYVTIEVKEEQMGGEHYLVAPELAVHLEEDSRRTVLYTVISRKGALFVWPVPLPREGQQPNPWHASAHEFISELVDDWGRVRANQAEGMYEMLTTRPAHLYPDPEWPELTPNDILRLAFKDRYIDSIDHSVLKALEGRA